MVGSELRGTKRRSEVDCPFLAREDSEAQYPRRHRGREREAEQIAQHWNDRKGDYLHRLEATGCGADSVDLVVYTHLHVDHVGWNTSPDGGKLVPTFPRARYLFGSQEYQYWEKNSRSGEETAVFEDSIYPIVSAGLADFVEPEDCPCKELRFIATPGHSAGHMSLIVSSNGEHALLAGDVAHNPCQFARLDWSSVVDFDGKRASQTRRALARKFADTSTLIFGGHFDPGRPVSVGDAFKMI
jgi:glyoxylase-like metal-dependent hydrolase (beta-lactamase superfamily II)